MARGWVERRGERYKGVVVRDDGTRAAKTFDTKREARDWQRDAVTDLKRGAILPRRSTTTFKDLVDEFEANAIDVRANTAKRDVALLRRHAEPVLGPLRVSGITRPKVQGFVTGMHKGGSAPATVRKTFALVRRLLEHAVHEGLIATNPAPVSGPSRIRLPKLEAAEMRFLTPTELAELARAVEPRYTALVLLGGYGGLRIGELAGLRVGDIDFMYGTVTVRRTLSDAGGRVTVGPPKTTASNRRVPLPGPLMDELKVHVETFCADGKDAPVFTSPEGALLRPNQFRRRVFAPAATSVGLEGLRIHDLRHTAASIWIAAGVHQKELSARLGHASIVLTDIYGHLYAESDAHFAERVGTMYVAPLPLIVAAPLT